MSLIAKTLLMVALAAPLYGADAFADDPPLEVTVGGTRTTSRAGSKDQTAASFVVRADELRAAGATVADALAGVPGVQVTRTGAGSELATAAIRGATAAQTPVYLAGIRLNDDVTGTADLSSVPPFALDRIEVYRGNAPLEADRLGIGGAIFLEPELPRAFRVGAAAGVGSFGELSTTGSAAGRAGGVFALASLRRDAAANDYTYVDDGGTRFDATDDRVVERTNADSEAYDAWAVAGADLGARGRVLAIGNLFLRDQGVTGLAIAPATRARLHTRRLLAGASTRSACAADADTACDVELATSVVSSTTKLTDPWRELAVGSTAVSSDGERLSQTERVRADLGRSATLTVAAGQDTERLAIDGDSSALVRARRVALRGAAMALVHVTSAVDLAGLVAADCHTTIGAGDARACSVLEPTGRVGARWKLAEPISVFANVGRYIRVPTLGELFGISPSLRGNAGLEPEQGLTFDGGGRWSARSRRRGGPRAYVDVFGFSRFASDLIGYRRSSFGAATPYNLSRARVLGVEAALGGQAFEMLRVELAATWLDPRDTTEGRQTGNDLLPFRSRLMLSPYAELFAEPALGAIGLDRIALGARATYRSSEVADPAGLVVIEPRTTVDVHVEASFFERTLVSRLRVANVFDVSSFDVVGYPLPGRSVHGTLEAWW